MTDRRTQLEAAEAKGMALFDAIERAGLIAPGRSETEVDGDIFRLAASRFGVEKNWHRRLVRTGLNTLCIFADHPPVRVIGADDTVFLDLGPVFEAWEADIGRTYALGDDPERNRLVADLARLFGAVRAHYHASLGITGAQLYAFAQRVAEDAGWRFGGTIAGHIVGEFPHATIPGGKTRNRIAPGNDEPMRAPDTLGRERHWILEIHLTDRARTFGGFYERLI